MADFETNDQMRRRLSVCGAPCWYGGRSMARKYSRSELGWWNHCNRKVKTPGEWCWQHPNGVSDKTAETVNNQL